MSLPSPTHSATPPHQPLYNVHASEEDIKSALKATLPESTYLSSTQLPHGSSFNNRIYVVKIQNSHPNVNAEADLEAKELIFKVSGRPWTKIKTLNEVNCLKLVAHHCPDLPVPRVLGFCTDRDKPEGGANEWILMTRLPGATAFSAAVGLNGHERAALIQEYAAILAALRTKIPCPRDGGIGNVVHVTHDGFPVLGDEVLNTDAKGAPWQGCLEYYTALLEAEMELLETLLVYESARHLLPQLRHFTTHTLPHLPIFTSASAAKPTFTHTDLADRNLLITRSPTPHITGLLDFEFAGFFPLFEDFVSVAAERVLGISPTYDASRDSAPHSKALGKLFDAMEGLGALTPQSEELRGHWRTAFLLRQVLDNVAPWYVRGRAAEDIGEEVQECAESCLKGVEELVRLVEE